MTGKFLTLFSAPETPPYLWNDRLSNALPHTHFSYSLLFKLGWIWGLKYIASERDTGRKRDASGRRILWGEECCVERDAGGGGCWEREAEGRCCGERPALGSRMILLVQFCNWLGKGTNKQNVQRDSNSLFKWQRRETNLVSCIIVFFINLRPDVAIYHVLFFPVVLAEKKRKKISKLYHTDIFFPFVSFS